MQLKCLIVDDEPLARARIRELLAEETDFEVVGESETGVEAVDAIRMLGPDLVFLDIQMPEMNGLEVVEQIGADQMPLTVFVTAYDQHALRAFEANALDYLLKPFDQERFQRTLSRVRNLATRPGRGQLQEKLELLLRGLDGSPQYLDRLVVRTGARHVLVYVDEIDHIQAEGNYVRIQAGAKTHLLRDTMGSLTAKLNPKEFVRIHRSTIVRIRNIVELESVFQGEYIVVLRDGTRLPSSRTYRAELERVVAIDT